MIEASTSTCGRNFVSFCLVQDCDALLIRDDRRADTHHVFRAPTGIVSQQSFCSKSCYY